MLIPEEKAGEMMEAVFYMLHTGKTPAQVREMTYKYPAFRSAHPEIKQATKAIVEASIEAWQNMVRTEVN